MALPKDIQEDLEKKQYGIFNHSAVQVCHWTKEKLRSGKGCYKEKFYGVHTQKCMQFSPSCMWCNQNCIFCWRPTEYMGDHMEDSIDPPDEIIPKLIEERKRLLIGFKGNDSVASNDFEDAIAPDHFAISLSGEPTLYPYLPEMTAYLKEKNARTIFVVTNGQRPEYFKRIQEERFQPTQLYISIEGYDKKSLQKITRGGDWETLLESISLFSSISCRRVFRITIMRGVNDTEEAIEGFRELIEKGSPDFIEVKSYMHLGMARERLEQKNMKTFDDIKTFSKRLLKDIPYQYEDEAKESVLVLLKRKDARYPTKIYS